MPQSVGALTASSSKQTAYTLALASQGVEVRNKLIDEGELSKCVGHWQNGKISYITRQEQMPLLRGVIWAQGTDLRLRLAYA